jgi:Flp pilus assembly protein TadD
MSLATETNQEAPDHLSQLLGGAIGRRLGLTTEELQLGLLIARNQLLRGAGDQALRTYTALVLCEPMSAEFQTGLANCALQIGQHHLALQAASALVALEPHNPKGYYFSGRASLGLKRYAEAREDLQEAVTLARKQSDAAVLREAEKLLALLASVAG